uniref:T-box domain-containing protein n=1 Tax=Echinococcus canadensis TaxID=519352 RepID=A0A915EY22_9CEST
METLQCVIFTTKFLHTSNRKNVITIMMIVGIKPNPTNLNCYRNQHNYKHSSFLHCLQQNHPYQQQHNYYDRLSGKHFNFGGWQLARIEYGDAQHISTHQSSPNILQMAGTIKERQEGNYEKLFQQGKMDAARFEVQQSSSAPPSAVIQDLQSVLLAITQRVPIVWHTHFIIAREKFSSIYVVGADFELLNSDVRQSLYDCMTRRYGGRLGLVTIFLTGKYATHSQSALRAWRQVEGTHACINQYFANTTLIDASASLSASHTYVLCSARECGSQLMACGMDFKLVQLTNNASNAISKNWIFARGMQDYLSSCRIVRQLTSEEAAVRTYVILETEFVVIPASWNGLYSKTRISANFLLKGIQKSSILDEFVKLAI